ncbi:hypothetical protein AOXY_G10509 [Acipenser oxyrinchus oxyrinchus]|uniref:CAP-Gly domain-containing protein n=1 Tax=Acipenser oxyrinchus oxyrinchus TaxID=40147 RepID=A0AAD8DEV3_ACIOX|nr:hypothetical protein AOXY_G10509 [Acipenser oxyrinchus oxyrinchus]
MDFNTAKNQLAKTPSIASEDTDFLMNEAEHCNETLQAADQPAEESKQLHETEDRRSRAPLQKALSQGSVLCPDGKEKYFTGHIGGSSECLAYRHSMHRTQSLSEKHSKSRRSRSVPGRSQSLSHIAGGSQCVTSEGMAGDVVEDVVGDELLLKPSSGLFHQSSLAVARATSTEKVSSTAEPDNGTLEGRENEVHKAATVLDSKTPNSPSCSLKLLLSSQIENAASHINSLNAREKIQDSKSHSNSSQVSSGSSTTGSETFDYSEEKKAIEQQARVRESESDQLAFNPSAASVLQRQIGMSSNENQTAVDLKSHINDLQEANENAVLELAKADEEISQLKADMAKLKAEYEDSLQDSLQRHSIFKEKVSRKHGEPLSAVSPGNSLDLQGEVCQLRSESRKLREANHRLNEENHWLQEELWDMRRQHERLLRTILHGTTDSTERGDDSSLAQVIEHTTEHNGKVDRVTSLLSERLPPPAHCRYGNVKSEPNNGLAEIELPSWEEREKERAQHSSSPLSLDSDGTDFLLVGFNKRNVSSKHVAFKAVQRKQISLTEDGILGDTSTEVPLSSTGLHSPGKESRPQPLRLGRPAQETLPGGLQDDSDELSDDNMSSISQITNGLNSAVHSSANTTATKSAIGHAPAPNGSQRRSPVVVLPRRPFAPRSIADLKVGSLVKFSRPGGKISKGTVKYQGNLPGRQEIYLGVELEGNEVGKHNGTFEGIRCFLCKPNKGVFVSFSKVIMAWE